MVEHKNKKRGRKTIECKRTPEQIKKMIKEDKQIFPKCYKYVTYEGKIRYVTFVTYKKIYSKTLDSVKIYINRSKRKRKYVQCGRPKKSSIKNKINTINKNKIAKYKLEKKKIDEQNNKFVCDIFCAMNYKKKNDLISFMKTLN